jgi:hypothetical protein
MEAHSGKMPASSKTACQTRRKHPSLRPWIIPIGSSGKPCGVRADGSDQTSDSPLGSQGIAPGIGSPAAPLGGALSRAPWLVVVRRLRQPVLGFAQVCLIVDRQLDERRKADGDGQIDRGLAGEAGDEVGRSAANAAAGADDGGGERVN